MKSKQKSYLILTVLFIGMLITFAAFKNHQQQPQSDKVLKIKESTINLTRNTIGAIYDYLDKSNLPQQEAKNLKQALAQADAAIQKDLTDSTLNKK